MKDLLRGFSRSLFLLPVLLGAILLLPGCSGGDSQCQKISQQQAATIESLNAEIIRLNEEIMLASKKQGGG